MNRTRRAIESTFDKGPKREEEGRWEQETDNNRNRDPAPRCIWVTQVMQGNATRGATKSCTVTGDGECNVGYALCYFTGTGALFDYRRPRKPDYVDIISLAVRARSIENYRKLDGG